MKAKKRLYPELTKQKLHEKFGNSKFTLDSDLVKDTTKIRKQKSTVNLDDIRVSVTQETKPNIFAGYSSFARSSCCSHEPTILEEAEYIIQDTDQDPELDPDSIYEQMIKERKLSKAKGNITPSLHQYQHIMTNKGLMSKALNYPSEKKEKPKTLRENMARFITRLPNPIEAVLYLLYFLLFGYAFYRLIHFKFYSTQKHQEL